MLSWTSYILQLPVYLILHITVVRGLSELSVGRQGAVDDYGQEETHRHLHAVPHLGGKQRGQPRDGEVQLGEETVQVGKVEGLDSDHVGEGDKGEGHLLLAEGRDAGLSLASVAAAPYGETEHEEDTDCSGKIVAEDDH